MTANDAKDWLDVFRSLGPWIIVVILLGFLVYALKNPEKVQVWQGIFETHFKSKKAQQNGIHKRVRGTLLGAIKHLSEDEKDLFPRDVGIRWIDSENETRDSFLDGNQVVLRINRSDNINKTISVAALEMSKSGTLVKGKRYMDGELATASDYIIARKLLASIQSGQSLGYFDEELFYPIYRNNPMFKEYFDKLLKADERGMFLSVFLNEVSKLSNLLFPAPFDIVAKAEITRFLTFLYELCVDQRKTLRFSGGYIKVDVAYTGTNNRLFHQGHQFYVDKCYRAFLQGIKTVYIFALGAKTQDAIAIEDAFNEQYPNCAVTRRKTYTHVFSDKKKNGGICIEFEKEDRFPLIECNEQAAT